MATKKNPKLTATECLETPRYRQDIRILPGGGHEDGAEVAHGHGEQHAVGGGLHARSAEDDDDDRVGDQGHHGQNLRICILTAGKMADRLSLTCYLLLMEVAAYSICECVKHRQQV